MAAQVINDAERARRYRRKLVDLSTAVAEYFKSPTRARHEAVEREAATVREQLAVEEQIVGVPDDSPAADCGRCRKPMTGKVRFRDDGEVIGVFCEPCQDEFDGLPSRAEG